MLKGWPETGRCKHHRILHKKGRSKKSLRPTNALANAASNLSESRLARSQTKPFSSLSQFVWAYPYRRKSVFGNHANEISPTIRSAGFQPAVSRISNPQAGLVSWVQPTRSRRYNRLETCATKTAPGSRPCAQSAEKNPPITRIYSDLLGFGRMCPEGRGVRRKGPNLTRERARPPRTPTKTELFSYSCAHSGTIRQNPKTYGRFLGMIYLGRPGFSQVSDHQRFARSKNPKK